LRTRAFQVASLGELELSPDWIEHNPQMPVRAHSRSKIASTVVAGLLLAAGAGGGGLSLAASGARQPSTGDVYPPPVKSKGGALSFCPNPVGLERFDARAEAAARSESLRYGRVSLAEDLASSDGAWQPSVRAMWARRDEHGPPASEGQGVAVRQVVSLRRDSYRVIVRRSCGEQLVRRSLTVTVGPRPAPGELECDACAETMFLVDRSGRALIYYIY
jgi:hypothetical protein